MRHKLARGALKDSRRLRCKGWMPMAIMNLPVSDDMYFSMLLESLTQKITVRQSAEKESAEIIVPLRHMNISPAESV